MASDVTVPVPGYMIRDSGRGAAYHVTVGEPTERITITGDGRTPAQAKQACTARLTEVLHNIGQRPAFGIDDDGTVIVAIPDAYGTSVYRVRPDSARMITHTNGAPEDEIARVEHYRPIPSN